MGQIVSRLHIIWCYFMSQNAREKLTLASEPAVMAASRRRTTAPPPPRATRILYSGTPGGYYGSTTGWLVGAAAVDPSLVQHTWGQILQEKPIARCRSTIQILYVYKCIYKNYICILYTFWVEGEGGKTHLMHHPLKSFWV